MHYFDYNATTPLSPAAREAWLKASDRHWFNASSLYREAGFTANALSAARERLADLLGCEAERIVFTSGATEANNALLAQLHSGQKLAYSAIEHPSVFAASCAAQRIVLPVDEHGVLCLEALQRTVQEGCTMVSVMAANNESGTLQPWREVADLCQSAGVKFHTDASQWLGKLPADGLGRCPYITGSAHKFGGPKGVGFLVLKDEDEALKWLRGGPQESGRRAGTENYPGIEAMVTALETCATPTDRSSLRDAFEQDMLAHFPELRVIGQRSARLWNTSLLVMPRHSNLKWLTRLSRRGFAISTGSACSSGKEGSSVVVQALGATPNELRRVVRLSSGWDTTAEDWQALSAAFAEVGAELDAER
jgi:cysteine desulfurase